MTLAIGTRPRSASAATFAETLSATLAACLLSACGGPNPAPEDANITGDTSRDAAVIDDTGGDVPPDAPALPGYQRGVVIGTLRGVPETSGIVASRMHPGVFWVHNDSDHAPELIAIDETATVLERVRLEGATNTDWEDIALASDPDRGDVIYIGDIGDNLARESMGARSSRGGVMRIYRVVEPNPRGMLTSTAAESFDVRYPARPYDCEAMFADPETGDLYFVTKDETADVFVAHAPFAAGSMTTLEHVTNFPILTATAADMSADGTRVVVRNYGEIRVFDITATEPRFVSAFATPRDTLPYTSFAEAICFGGTGYDLYTISEGEGARLFRLPYE